MTATVSVVLPTFNRLERLKVVLQALATQSMDPADYEVIVVSDGSTDGTDDYLKTADLPCRFSRITQSNSGPAAARNRGLDMASGRLVLFLDDDVVATEGLIEQHARAHIREGDGAVVIGPMATPTDRRLGRYARWEQSRLYKQYAALARGDYAPTFRQFYTGNASVERDLVRSVGGFDERLRRAEDVELAYRLHRRGARFVYDGDAVGVHYADRAFNAWIQIARDYGSSEIRFSRCYGDSERLTALHYEFLSRNPVTRRLIRTTVGRGGVERLIVRLMAAAAAGADRLHLERAVLASLSVVYSSAFYSSAAEELGGRTGLLGVISPGVEPSLPS